MTIVDFPLAPKRAGPCTVTLIGFWFTAPDGAQKRLTASITVQDGNYSGIISAIQQNGGVFLPPEKGDESRTWFLPWPCAAVQIVSGDPECVGTPPQFSPESEPG